MSKRDARLAADAAAAGDRLYDMARTLRAVAAGKPKPDRPSLTEPSDIVGMRGMTRRNWLTMADGNDHLSNAMRTVVACEENTPDDWHELGERLLELADRARLAAKVALAVHTVTTVAAKAEPAAEPVPDFIAELSEPAYEPRRHKWHTK